MIINPGFPVTTDKVSKSTVGALWWIALALGITAANMINEASVEFSLLSGLFIVITYLAVTALGGLKYLFGAAVGYMALQHVIVSCFSKFLLGEPIEARLEMPVTTMSIYCVGMASCWAGALVAKRINPTRGRVLFAPVTDAKTLRHMAYFAIFLEIGQVIVTRLHYAALASGATQGGGISGIIQQMTFIVPLTVGCATASCVLGSNGKKSFNLLIFMCLVPPVLSGVAGAGRIEATEAVISYFVSAYLFGFKFRPIHVVALALLALFAGYVLFPYALIARRDVRGPDIVANAAKAAQIFQQVLSDPMKYQTSDFEQERLITPARRRTRFFDPPRPLLERFGILKSTDGIGHGAQMRAPLGWFTTVGGLQLATPSFLSPDKQIFGNSNFLGRLEPGLVYQNDYFSQPVVGFFVDAYASFRWIGVIVVPFLVILLFSALYKMLVDLSLTKNVFAIALAIPILHSFSESPIAPQIVTFLQIPFGVVFGFAAVKFGASLLGRKKAADPALAPVHDDLGPKALRSANEASP